MRDYDPSLTHLYESRDGYREALVAIRQILGDPRTPPEVKVRRVQRVVTETLAEFA